MRVEIRIKPDDIELSSVKYIEGALDMNERTITDPKQSFWIFDSVSRALRALKSLDEVEKIRLFHAKK